MHPHRSNALHGAAAVLTAARTRVVAVIVLVSSALGPRVRGCPALRGTVLSTLPRSRTPYTLCFANKEHYAVRHH